MRSPLIYVFLGMFGCADFQWPWERDVSQPKPGQDIDPNIDPEPDTGDTYDPVATRLVVSQPAVLLTEAGEERQLEATVLDLLGGLRSACTYTGAAELKEMSKRTTFVRVTQQLNPVFDKN